MVVGFEEHGFMVAAKHMPDTCTDCPFWENRYKEENA
jgi:hypothetical protein